LLIAIWLQHPQTIGLSALALCFRGLRSPFP
jgi:hypothetical protein